MRHRILLAGLGVVLLGALLAYRYVLTHGFSAREKPSAVEAAIARRLRGLATEPSVKRLKNPLTPTPLLIAEARDHFADHCALCHGNDGKGKTMINEGLYPPAPELGAEDTQALTDGELLSIIKNGIRFTGMPGWGGSDEENWELVLFIRHLPTITDEELQLMREVNSEPHSGGELDATYAGARQTFDAHRHPMRTRSRR
jgi:mono/diheme cytochrome c family protein